MAQNDNENELDTALRAKVEEVKAKTKTVRLLGAPGANAELMLAVVEAAFAYGLNEFLGPEGAVDLKGNLQAAVARAHNEGVGPDQLRELVQAAIYWVDREANRELPLRGESDLIDAVDAFRAK